MPDLEPTSAEFSVADPLPGRCPTSASERKPDDTDPPTTDFGDASVLGDGLSAGCRLLQARYHLPAEATVLINTAVVATALGPSVRVRNPWGADLPPSLETIFCAAPQSILPAAIADAFRFFRQAVGDKLRWREAVGSRRLRADFLAVLAPLEAVEKQVLQGDSTLRPPPAFPAPTITADEVYQRTTLERQQHLARREELRAELAERRMDLFPFIVAEDPGWDTLHKLDQLAFDRCLTVISPAGAAIRELCACSPRQLGKLARLLQASRRGGDLTDGASILLNPMLVLLHIAGPDLVTTAFHHPAVREGGFLDGLIFEVTGGTSRLEASAFVESEEETAWHELLARLFTQRGRGATRLYLLDHEGFEAMEDFRQWTREIRDEAKEDRCGFVAGLPAQVLKLALCFHLAAGKEDMDTIGAATLEYAVELVRRIATRQRELLARLVPARSKADAMAGAVTRMAAKLASLGGGATVRELFRGYSGQDYNALTPVLDQAVQQGLILRDGRNLRLPSSAVEAGNMSSSASTRQSRSRSSISSDLPS